MPEMFCTQCQQFAPIKWNQIGRCWMWWPHDKDDGKGNTKRCGNGDKVAKGRIKTKQDYQAEAGE